MKGICPVVSVRFFFLVSASRKRDDKLMCVLYEFILKWTGGCWIYSDVQVEINQIVINPLAAKFFLCYPPGWHGDNFLHTFAWHGIFFHVYCLARTFFFGTHVSRVENWSFTPIYSKDKCIYTIFKAANQETKFLRLCTKPYIDKHTR